MSDISELIERLRYFEDCDVPDGSGSGSTITARWYRNVDGPEAATALETLQAENERLRTTIKELKNERYL